jgi:flagellar hook-associated protein 3 FlgL
MKFSLFTDSFRRLQRETQNVATEISSGKRINTASDDPEGVKLVLSLLAQGAEIDGRRESIAAAQTWMKTTETSLSAVNSFLGQALGIAQSSASTSAAERSGMAETIQTISEQALSLANSKIGKSYVFSGSLTDKAPFVASGVPASPYVYSGNAESLKITTQKDSTETYNLPGDAIFLGVSGGAPLPGGVDIFQTLQDLQAGLQNNDSAAIAAQTSKLADAIKQVQDGIEKTGTMSKSVDIADSRLVSQRNAILKQIDGVQNADVPTLAMEFQMQSLVLNASYSTASKIGGMSILNFLK